MVRVAYFHNECAPYRMPIFEGLSKLANVDLAVYFGRYRSSIRRWHLEPDMPFDCEVLSEVDALARLFSLDPEDDPNPFNLSLFFKLLSNRFDVFIAGAPHYFGTMITFMVSKMLRRPFILFLEDVDAKGKEITSYLRRFLDFRSLRILTLPFILARFICFQVVLRNSDCYIVPGTATREFLLRRGVSSSKIFTAFNVVDNEAIQKECRESAKENRAERLKAKLALQDKRVILSVAYLSERKGIQYLIAACAKLKEEKGDFALIVVGEGPYKESLKRTSAQAGLGTVFAGYVSDLVDYYLAADVFVLPTLFDVWGFVINEAMACGCPIIATSNAGASRDLVKNEVNGYVVQPENVLELCWALKRVLYDDKLRQKMKGKSKEMISLFSYENNIRGYKKAIDYVLNQKH
jgi:glycosyltransferase involved in cell wall biosynthesis